MSHVRLVCVIRDRLAEDIGPIMAFPAVPAAVRSFADVAVDPQTMVARHPEDFELLQVATIDGATGVVVPCTPPVVLLTGVAWLASQKRADMPPADGQLSLLKEA